MPQAFPPSFVDYFLRAQTTSLPGHEKLTQAMPATVLETLERAEEDVEAEAYADSVNGTLKLVFSGDVYASAWHRTRRPRVWVVRV